MTPDADRQDSLTFITNDGTTAKTTLPIPEKSGVTLHVEEKDGSWCLMVRTTDNINPYNVGLSVMNEGKICYFRQINESDTTFHIPTSSLMPGVNQATVFDSRGQVLADRLFFVWKDSTEQPTLKIEGLRDKYQPYEKVELFVGLTMSDSTEYAYPHYFSLAVRDGERAERTYDNANILTEMLLASEIRGFVPDAAWFFQTDDAEHRDALDLLLMVQGWRRFSWKDMAADSAWQPLRPMEKTITLMGNVYNLPQNQHDDKDSTEYDWVLHTEAMNPQYQMSTHMYNYLYEDGRFAVQLPLYSNYSCRDHILFMDVIKKESDFFIAEIKDRNHVEYINKRSFLLPKTPSPNKQKKQKMMPMETGNTNWPEFTIRLDKPFPRFVQPYSFYQKHLPERKVEQNQLTQTGFRDDCPLIMMDPAEIAYGVNDAGLSTVVASDIKKAIAVLSLNNFNNNITVRLGENEGEGSIEKYVLYADANLRDTTFQTSHLTIVEYPYPDGIKRVMPASRTFYMPGFAQRVEFYHPNYKYQPENPNDYRRTLYWAPFLKLNRKGKTRITFYNNSRTTRLSIEAEGQAADGTLLWGKTE